MNHLELCEKVYSGELSALEAHNLITPKVNIKNLKRAHFVKMRIHLPNESRRLNAFLRILFGLPLPLFIARWGLKIASKKNKNQAFGPEGMEGISFEEISQLIKYAKGTKIKVESNDATIRIIIK